jgi:hypothetical protein
MVVNGYSLAPYSLLSWGASFGTLFANTISESFDFSAAAEPKVLSIEAASLAIGQTFRQRQFFRYGAAAGPIFTWRLTRYGAAGAPPVIFSLALPAPATAQSRGLITTDFMIVDKAASPTPGYTWNIRLRGHATITMDQTIYASGFADYAGDFVNGDYLELRNSWQFSVASANNNVREELGTWERLIGDGTPGNT